MSSAPPHSDRTIGHWAAVCRHKSKPRSAQYQYTGQATHHKYDRKQDRTHDRTHDRTYDRTFYELKFNELNFNEITENTTTELNTDLCFTLRGLAATMKVKVDSGAEGNILPLSTYLGMYPEHCRDTRPTPGHLNPS